MDFAAIGRRIAVVAPHPDDETLGAGGTLNRARRQGCELHWIIVTEMGKSAGYSPERIANRDAEIERVSAHYGFRSTRRLGFPPAGLVQSHTPELVAALGEAFDAVHAETVLVTHPGDAHSDHALVFNAVNAAVKSFRRPAIRSLMVYETLSETGYNLDPSLAPFRPNLLVRLDEGDLAAKIAAMEVFEGEIAGFPFPRSAEAIRALARLRGSECGASAAEAFMLLRLIV